MEFMMTGPYWPNLRSIRAYSLFAKGEAADVDFRGDSHLSVSCRRQAEKMANFASSFHWIDQAHGNKAILLPSENDIEVDGVVTHTPRTACVMRSADCLPVLFATKDEKAVGIAHAGWRGLQTGIIQSTFRRLDRAPHEVLCWMGPAISARHYEVDDFVLNQFQNDAALIDGVFEPKGHGKFFMDMYKMAQNILEGIGIHRDQISGGDLCTYSDARLHSVRRDGKAAGRFASLIWID